MKRLAIILVFGFVLLSIMRPAVSAQTGSPFQYGMLFRTGDTLKVAMLDDEGEWEVQTIPQYLLFGQYDVMLEVPKWTDGGDIMGVGYDPALESESEPIYESPATHIYRYDTESQTLSTHDAPIVIQNDADDSRWPELLAITSVSPRGEYVTAFDVFAGRGYLIETATGEVLVEQDSCGLKAFAWQDNVVHLGSHFNIIVCDQPAFFAYDLAANERVDDLAAGFEGSSITVIDEGHLIGENDWLLEAYGDPIYYQIAWLNEDGLQFSAPLNFDSLRISATGQSAAFGQADSGDIIYVDLLSGEQYTISVDKPSGFEMAFEGETLRYVGYVGSNQKAIAIHSFLPNTGNTSAELTLVDDSWTDFAVSPTLEWLATEYEGVVRIYDVTENVLIWESTPELEIPSELNGLNWVGDLKWSDDGLLEITWEHSVLVDAASGEVIMPPEENAVFLSASPDGEWLLYAVWLDDAEFFTASRIEVMHRDTGDVVVLSDGEAVYNNFHFDFHEYFIWSPQLD